MFHYELSSWSEEGGSNTLVITSQIEYNEEEFKHIVAKVAAEILLEDPLKSYEDIQAVLRTRLCTPEYGFNKMEISGSFIPHWSLQANSTNELCTDPDSNLLIDRMKKITEASF